MKNQLPASVYRNTNKTIEWNAVENRKLPNICDHSSSYSNYILMPKTQNH